MGTWAVDREALIDSFLLMAFEELEEERANGAERRSEPFEVGPAEVDVDVRFLEPATRR